MARIGWNRVPADVRDAVCEHTGPVITAYTASEGLNSEIAVFLDTAAGPVFVKGRPTGRPAVTQRREAVINPYVRHVAPRLLWRLETGSWDVLVFEHIDGRHADYTPGSDHAITLFALATCRMWEQIAQHEPLEAAHGHRSTHLARLPPARMLPSNGRSGETWHGETKLNEPRRDFRRSPAEPVGGG